MPIDPDYTEIIEDCIATKKIGKVHFFAEYGKINCTSEGFAICLKKESNRLFVIMSDGILVRADKIIALMGRPGPAYDEYDRYANACLTCEDLGQF
jgi:hypothetical protein